MPIPDTFQSLVSELFIRSFWQTYRFGLGLLSRPWFKEEFQSSFDQRKIHSIKCGEYEEDYFQEKKFHSLLISLLVNRAFWFNLTQLYNYSIFTKSRFIQIFLFHKLKIFSRGRSEYGKPLNHINKGISDVLWLMENSLEWMYLMLKGLYRRKSRLHTVFFLVQFEYWYFWTYLVYSCLF